LREIILETMFRANFSHDNLLIFQNLIEDLYKSKGGLSGFYDISSSLQTFLNTKFVTLKMEEIRSWLLLYRPKQNAKLDWLPQKSTRELDETEFELIDFLIGIENLPTLLVKLDEIDTFRNRMVFRNRGESMIENYTGLPPWLRDVKNPDVNLILDSGLI